jgi:hypothetical protein
MSIRLDNADIHSGLIKDNPLLLNPCSLHLCGFFICVID